MRMFGKSLGEYVHFIKIPLILILVISIIQSVSILWKDSLPFIWEIMVSGNFYFFQRNFANPVFILEFLEAFLVLFFGFRLVIKKRFNLKQNFLVGIFCFIPSLLVFFFIPALLPSAQFIFQLRDFCILLFFAFALFVLASFLGWALAKAYIKLKKGLYQRRLYDPYNNESKLESKSSREFNY